MNNYSENIYTQKLDILWEPVEGGARILRVYGEHPVLLLPERIEDLPVTEIGAYCFSRSEPKLPEKYYRTSIEAGRSEHTHVVSATTANTPGTVATETGTPETVATAADTPGTTATAGLSCLGGSSLQAVHLPSSVTTLHNAAFYNCRELHTLSAGNQIRSIGSDEFMNCTKLSRLIMRCSDTEATGLSLFLERFAENLLVLFVPHPDCETDAQAAPDRQFAPSESAITATLFFPEYYEWLDEISPAHLFSRSIHGEGFRMRKCFEDARVNYDKYDQCFANALQVESEETLCRIAIARLRWPNGLASGARTFYEAALGARIQTAVSLAIKERNLSLLLFLCRFFSERDFTGGSDIYRFAISACVEADWGEGSARLMEEKHRQGNFAQKSFDFE